MTTPRASRSTKSRTPVVRVRDEKTGDPAADNAARRWNKALHRATAGAFRVKARGRRRRKEILRIEYPRYAVLVATVATGLRAQSEAAGVRR